MRSHIPGDDPGIEKDQRQLVPVADNHTLDGGGFSLSMSILHHHTEENNKQGIKPAGSRTRRQERAGDVGLSTVHNRTQEAHVDCWMGASLVTATREKERHLLTPKKKVAKRGAVKTFSRSSRRRLMRTLARTKRSNMPIFVTLTYPAIFPEDPQEWKRHLKNFFARLGRQFPGAAGVWKLEPQKRGAPHYHLLIWGVDYVDLRFWVPRAWYEVVGSDDKKHLAAGTRVEELRSWNGVMSYASKYLGKVDKAASCAELWQAAGRYWGVFQRENMPWGEMVTVPCSEKEAVQAIRYLRRFGHIPARDYAKLTAIASADFWYAKLFPI
jgi:hypothetical protein